MRSQHWNKIRPFELGTVEKYQLCFTNPAQMDVNPDLQEGEMHVMNLPLNLLEMRSFTSISGFFFLIFSSVEVHPSTKFTLFIFFLSFFVLFYFFWGVLWRFRAVNFYTYLEWRKYGGGGENPRSLLFFFFLLFETLICFECVRDGV